MKNKFLLLIMFGVIVTGNPSEVLAVSEPVVVYSQPDYSVVVNAESVPSFNLFTGVNGRISNLKFAYNDNGSGLDQWVGVSVVDITTGTNYYAFKEGVGEGCGDAYQSSSLNEKVLVELDSTFEYRGYPCTGSNLFLDPTHTYGVALFRNRGGLPNTPVSYYGSSQEVESVYLHVEVSPKEEVCTEECFSNVLFLPGIKGSVLKKGNDTLWPTTALSNDVPQLALTSTGESVNDVYVDGIVQNFSIAPIYEPFSEFMNEMVSEGTINEWLPLGYDWRFGLEDVVRNGVKNETGVINIIDRIEELAASSITGKVIIVGHSMGGLLGKVIIKTLEEQGKADLIESFVMVGTPQLGTPQAIGALLHGDEESLVFGLYAEAEKMRAIARDMPSGYSLLPSRRYFQKSTDPVIVFSPVSFTQTWRAFWGNAISSYLAMSQFVTGVGVLRDRPFEMNVLKPEVLRNDLLLVSDNFHNKYDTYEIPENIRSVQIAGWGLSTIKSLQYKNMHGVPFIDVNYTKDGDKTVIGSSAIDSNLNEAYYFNLKEFRENSDNKKISHKDILNAESVQKSISSIIKRKVVEEDDFISVNKPAVTSLEDELVVSSNSPVILGAYDEEGNFTGVVQNQDITAEVLEVKEDIPGSSFVYTVGSQTIFVPKDGNYTFVYKGTGEGPTTVEIETMSKDVTSSSAVYTDVPTTINTEASIVIDGETSQSPIFSLDTNGDGKTDAPVLKDNATMLDMVIYLKQKVEVLAIKPKLKQALLQILSKIEGKIKKDKKKSNLIILKIMEQVIEKMENKKHKGIIPDAEAQSGVDLLTKINTML